MGTTHCRALTVVLEGPEPYGNLRFVLLQSSRNCAVEARPLSGLVKERVPVAVEPWPKAQRLLPAIRRLPQFAADTPEGKIDRWKPLGGKLQREAHEKVAGLKEKLAALHMQLATAELEALCADDVMTASGFAQSAVSRMPVELWLEILRLACGWNPVPSIKQWGMVCPQWHAMVTRGPIALLLNPVQVNSKTPLEQIRRTLTSLRRSGRAEVELCDRFSGPDAFCALHIILGEETLAVLSIRLFYDPTNVAVRQATNLLGVPQIHTLCLSGSMTLGARHHFRSLEIGRKVKGIAYFPGYNPIISGARK
ncbi:hypothetical protein C8R47DRAFT_1067225 [Mycena vitilis]|nr:hypothetical protein C8R47DRAFT_1067225 [Mycena vitilis]